MPSAPVRSPRSTLLFLFLLGLSSARAWGSPLPGGYPAETTHSVALHMHGSMSEQYGSMEWHTDLADSLGIDVIWWTDHDWRLSLWRHMKKFDFENTTWNAVLKRWIEPDENYSGELRWWQDTFTNGPLTVSVADSLAWGGTHSFRLEANGAPANPLFEAEYLEQWASQLHNRYPLAMRVGLSFAVFPEQLDPFDSRFVVQVELSDHPEGQHILRYVLGSMEGEGSSSIPLAYTPGTWNHYQVDVTADAFARFSQGGADSLRVEDNSLVMVKIGLETRNDATPVVFFDEYAIDTDESIVDDVLLDRVRDITSYYETLTPAVTQYVGYEISHFKAQPHINGYAPGITVVDYTGRSFSDTLYYAIDHVRSHGGAVSLNHVFGPQPPDPPESPEDRAARLQFTKRSNIKSRLLGVDVLEVGYRWRGGMNLWEHVSFWDAMNANAVFVSGNGITDSHGRGWPHIYGWQAAASGDSTTNNFTTWFWTENLAEADFVKAMKNGRAYFGDPYRFSGTVDLGTLDGFRMGQIVLTDRTQHDVVVEATGLPAGAQVRFLQGEIREYVGPAWPTYSDVNFLRDEFLPGIPVDGAFADTVTVDTTLPSFVRVELYDAQSDELAFSNPIHFVTTVPQNGIRPERIAARLGEVRLYLGEEFVLTDASVDSAAGVLTIEGDETTAGLGQLTIDPGAWGEPSNVVGAGAWSYVAGVLTLTGFSGVGSTVTLVWGPSAAGTNVGLPATPVLSPGRPNPFGPGTLTEYAIPRDGWVRLEVLDVTGRRVRVLDLGFRSAGYHRVRWDGTDESGRSVAAGVYYLRLEHGGESLVRKAVRVR